MNIISRTRLIAIVRTVPTLCCYYYLTLVFMPGLLYASLLRLLSCVRRRPNEDWSFA